MTGPVMPDPDAVERVAKAIITAAWARASHEYGLDENDGRMSWEKLPERARDAHRLSATVAIQEYETIRQERNT